MREPETAAELVAYNFMMDGLEARVAFLEERLEYLRELYDLMGEYNIPISPDDMTDYLGMWVVVIVCITGALDLRNLKPKLRRHFSRILLLNDNFI